MKYVATTLCAAAAAATAALPALAQDYPARSMEWIVPAPAGGGTDTAGRMLATLVEDDLGQAIAVKNVAGGGGSAGMSQFIQSAQDSYTLAAVWNGPLTTVPNIQNVPYAPEDYRPIVSTSETAYTMCVKPDFPAETGQEMLDEIAANPEKYTYGNDGVGGTMQLAAERIFAKYEAVAIPIPFGGAGETLQNFLGGHVDIYGGSIAPVQPYVESGEAKCLIVTSADPVEALPQASSMGDLGFPELATYLWRALLGPKSMTDAEADVIVASVEKAMQDEEYIAFLAKRGEWPAVYSGAELQKRIDDEYQALGEAAERIGLK